MTLFKCQMYLARTALIGDTFQIELEFRNVGFLRRGENRSTRRKISRSKDENQQQTQPTYDAETGNRTRATLVGGERSHHCAIPAPSLRHPCSLTCCNLGSVLISLPTSSSTDSSFSRSTINILIL